MKWQANLPQVIVLATSKGGAGKSTLARNLAAYWQLLGHKPAVIDADPQRSIAARHADSPLKDIPIVAEPEERIGDAIASLQPTRRPVIVDTAGFRNRTTIRALVAADLALIPLKPSAEDVDGALATYQLIQEINQTPERAGRPIQARLVLTMALQGTVIARHVREQLENAGYPLLKAEMSHRVAYPEAGITGSAPCLIDPDGAAARDIAAIAQEIAASKTKRTNIMKSSGQELRTS